jgi:hypothetical protein
MEFPKYKVTIKSRKQRQHKILLCHGNKLQLWTFLGGGVKGVLCHGIKIESIKNEFILRN